MILEAPAHYTLSSYEPVHVAEPAAHVTEEMIEAQLTREMARFARFEEAPGPACEGDCLRANLNITVNGQLAEDVSGQGVTVVLSHDAQPAGFVGGVVGMACGDTRSFDFTATDRTNPAAPPDAFHVEIELLEKKRRVVPELTDEFVRTRLSEHDKTVGEFRERVRAYLARQLEAENTERREQRAVEELGRRLKESIPDELIEQARDEILDSLTADLTAGGMTLAQFIEQQGMNERRFQMTIMMQARESLRQGFALDALWRHLRLPIDDAARERALEELAPGQTEQARKLCDEQGWGPVEAMARRQAACDWLMRTAVFE